MFFEIFHELELDLSDLKKTHCYSFVMQHKENRIVSPINKNQIYLAESYKLSDEPIIESDYDDDLISKCPSLIINNIPYTDCHKMISYYSSTEMTPYYVMGIVIRNLETGYRSKIRNPNYEIVRKIRGNQSNDLYNYLCLRKNGNLSTYLQYYPEDKKKFYKYRELVHIATLKLYNMYQTCYIYKKNSLNEFPTAFKTHIYKLHYEVYLLQLKPEQKNMRFVNVKEYVNNMHPSLLIGMLTP